MLMIDSHSCLSCAGCIALCPETALYHDNESLRVIQNHCTLCGICVKFCPMEALSIHLAKADLQAGKR